MPAPAMLEAPRPAAAPKPAATRPTTARQQQTASATTYGRPDSIADSHVAMSNASVAQAMQAAPPIGGAPRLDPKRMLLTGQDAGGNASVAGFAQQTMPVAGPAIRSGPPSLVVPAGPKPGGNPGLPAEPAAAQRAGGGRTAGCAPPPGMTCPPARSCPGSVTNQVAFPVASSALTAAKRADIAGAAAAWHAAGGGVRVRVD